MQQSPGLLIELWRGWKTGAGMFCESYFIFSVGNTPTVWKLIYPSPCYNGIPKGHLGTDPACVQATTAVPFVPVAGIIIGMVTFGLMSDWLGRRLGSRLTVSFMLLGSIMMTISDAAGPAGLFTMFDFSLFLFALGVGGEYPMAASSASERSEHEHLPRGRTVTFTFANQGWGNLVNTAVLLFMLQVTGTGSCTTALSLDHTFMDATNTTTKAQFYCDPQQLEIAWRLSFAIGVPFVACLWVYRFFFLPESAMWATRQGKFTEEELAAKRLKRIKHTRMLFSRKYLPRLIGAAGTWFL
jgi:MFS family permease